MLARENSLPMASDESAPNTRAVGAGLNAARHGRSDDVPADTPIGPSAPQDPASEQRGESETSEPRSVPAQAPTILDSATPTGLSRVIAPYVKGASVQDLATCFAAVWSPEQRQRLLVRAAVRLERVYGCDPRRRVCEQ